MVRYALLLPLRHNRPHYYNMPHNFKYKGWCIFYTGVNVTLLGKTVLRFEEGHAALMRQAFHDLRQDRVNLPSEVDPELLILGNIRRDIPHIEPHRNVSWTALVVMMWQGITCRNAQHPEHAMRCLNVSVDDAYAEMVKVIRRGFTEGCDASLSWKQRTRAFGGMLHTLQDSYCTAHAGRIDNADATSPLIDMYTYPSRQHPFTTRKDSVWQDKAKTTFKPYAGAAIQATVAALKIFSTQSLAGIDQFMQTYVSYRPDIRG